MEGIESPPPSLLFKMNLKVRLEDRLNGKCNHKHMLVLYLDGSTNPHHYWKDTNVRHEITYPVTLYGMGEKSSSTNNNNTDDVIKIPARCSVCALSYRYIPSEFGKLCWVEQGFGSVLLRDLISNEKTKRNLPLKNIDGQTTCILQLDSDIFSLVIPLHHRVGNNLNNNNNNDGRISLVTTDNNKSFFVGNFIGSGKSALDLRKPDQITFAYPNNNNNNNTSEISTPMNHPIRHRLNITDVKHFRGFSVKGLPPPPPPSSSVIAAPKTQLNNNNTADRMLSKYLLNAYYSHIVKEYKECLTEWIKGDDRVSCLKYPSFYTLRSENDNLKETNNNNNNNNTDEIPLPFSAFIMTNPPHIDASYWINSVKTIALRRGFKSFDEFARYIFIEHVNDPNHIAILAAELVCMYAQMMEYKPDEKIDVNTSRLEGTEVFGDALFVLSGDCEDVAHVIVLMMQDFTSRKKFVSDLDSFEKMIWKPFITFDEVGSDEALRKRTSSSSSTTTSLRKNAETTLSAVLTWFGDIQHNIGWEEILTLMQIVLKEYVPMFCIEGVTNSSAQNTHDDEGSKAPEIQGAHASVKCFPTWYFMDCLKRWNPNHPIIATTKVDNNNNNNNNDDNNEKWSRKLRLLLFEGTGMLNPGMQTDIWTQERSSIYNIGVLKPAKKPLFLSKAKQMFYVASTFGATNAFVTLCHTATFYICTIPQQQPQQQQQQQQQQHLKGDVSIPFCEKISNQKLFRGALFQHIAEMSDHIMIVPYGEPLHFLNKQRKSDGVVNTSYYPEFCPDLISSIQMGLEKRVKLNDVLSPPPLSIVIEQQQQQQQQQQPAMQLHHVWFPSSSSDVDKLPDNLVDEISFKTTASKLRELKRNLERHYKRDKRPFFTYGNTKRPTPYVYTNTVVTVEGQPLVIANDTGNWVTHAEKPTPMMGCKVDVYLDEYYILNPFVVSDNVNTATNIRFEDSLYESIKNKVDGFDYACEFHSDRLRMWRLTFFFKSSSSSSSSSA